MKKLLSILRISTLTASVPAPLLANTLLTRVKRDVGVSNSNNEYVPPKEIKNIKDKVSSIAIDKNNNIYFVKRNSDGVFLLKYGETIPTPIDGINGKVLSVAVDNSNNIYFGTDSGIFLLEKWTTIPKVINGITGKINSLAVDTKNNIYFVVSNLDSIWLMARWQPIPTPIDGINGKVLSVAVDSNNNIYYGKDNGTFVLKQGAKTPNPIKGINGYKNFAVDSNNNIYYGTDSGAYMLQTVLSWTKQQSQFVLVESTKTQTWTRPDLFSVDGELNIDIANPNIDKVVFDNVLQGQTNKHWTINVKPETKEKDHNLQVMFIVDGKQYTNEITVSMQAKIDPPTPSVKENLSDVIKFADENNLGNIIYNNDSTIFAAITQINARTVDFSQIEITDKTDTQATLTAKKDSKSYQGSVDVTYNIIPATVVDLKIDVILPSSTATVIKDYLGQINDSNITNLVNTFYYANSESVITMVKPTASSVITGVVYGCDENWNKTSQSSTIEQAKGIKLDGSQLATKDGKYVVELSDNLGHTNNVYLQIAPKQKNWNYFDTDNGKQFEMWAKANGHDNIRGYSASQLNKLFAESKNWQQLASDSQFASAVADWFKTNGKLSSTEPLTKEQVIEQLKTQIPSSITIPTVNTSNYDVNKVSFELNQSEFNPNDKVNITVKYNNASAEQFTLQIKDSNAPDNKKKTGLGIWTIFGIVVGSLAGLALLGWLFKRFVINPFVLKPIRKKKEKAFVAKTEKDIAQMKKDDEEWEAKQKGDK